MPKPQSADLRKRVIAAAEADESCRSAAARFEVSASVAITWVQRARLTGSLEAKPMGGRRPFVLAAHCDWVLARVAENPT